MDIEILNALKELKNTSDAPAGRKLLEPTKASKRMTRAINELYNKPKNKRPLKEADEDESLNEDWSKGLECLYRVSTQSVLDACKKGACQVGGGNNPEKDKLIGRTSLRFRIYNENGWPMNSPVNDNSFINLEKGQSDIYVLRYDSDFTYKEIGGKSNFRKAKLTPEMEKILQRGKEDLEKVGIKVLQFKCSVGGSDKFDSVWRQAQKYNESLNEDMDPSVPDWAKDEIKKTWGQSYNRGVPQGSDWNKELNAPLTDIKVVEVDDPSTLSASKVANKNSEAFVLMPNGRVANLKKFIGKDRQDILNKAVKACYYKKLPEDSAEYQDNLAKRDKRLDWTKYDRNYGRGLNGRESGQHGYRNYGNQSSYYWHSDVDKSGYFPNEEMKQLKRYKNDEQMYNRWAARNDEEAQQYMKKALDATRYADDNRKQAKDQNRAYRDKIAKSKAELRAKADERKGQKKESPTDVLRRHNIINR